MPRPCTKDELINLAEKEFKALEKQLSSLPPLEKLPASSEDFWGPGDFVAHLWEWQNMFFGWYEAGLRGENPPIPAQGYKWNQLPALNREIYRKYQDWNIKKLTDNLRASHFRLMEMIKQMPEEELFISGRHSWTRTNTLASYLISTTSSHYLWAAKEIKKIQKQI